ncbi:hypothetical protein V8E36_007760 [Tilletia maclaganii]
MGLLLAPYNNAMRLGQGFNSYTHEICVDDAVIISPQQAENEVTNDGNTMRLTALILGQPSAWTKQEQVLLDVTHVEEAFENRQEIMAERAITDSSAQDEQAESPKDAGLEDDRALPESEALDIASTVPEPISTPAPPSATEAPTLDHGPGSVAPAGSASASTSEEEPVTTGESSTKPDDDKTGEGVDSGSTTQAAGNEAGIDVKGDNLNATEDAGGQYRSAPNERPDAPEDVEGTDKVQSDKTAQDAQDVTGTSKADNVAAGESSQQNAGEGETSAHDDASKTEPAPAKTGADAASSNAQQTPVPAPKTPEQVAAEKKQAELDLQRKRKEVARVEHRKQRQNAMEDATSKFKIDLDLDKMAAMHRAFLLPDPTKKAPKVGQQTKVFDIKNTSGVSQTVVFQSRFVEKISEVVSDMGVSAGLSVKKGSCGGSGRASFIDTDRFKFSDMNYWISVKVVNQSINFKDALEFNKLDNVADKDFRSVFGDCFISGFLEGGELNALISMKILNKAKFNDIKAEGTVRLGLDAADIQATGAFKRAKTNLDLNTQTTIQVSWIGGGLIKPPEEAWTIDSLARAASRFPDNVARSPQRTHAILTKYETLRSYQALKPKSATELDYKSAALYTNELLDTFMSYKSLYTRLSTQISDVQRGQIKFKAEKRPDLVKLSEERKQQPPEKLNDAEKKSVIGNFPPTIDGLDDARGMVREQMNYIVERVDEIAKDPSGLAEKQQEEKYLPVFAFESLLPTMQSAFRTSKRSAPLTGEKMFKDGEQAEPDTAPSTAYRLCPVKIVTPPKTEAKGAASTATNKDTSTTQTPRAASLEAEKALQLRTSEKTLLEKYLSSREPGIEDKIKLTAPLGSEISKPVPGTLFSALDFVKTDFLLEHIAVTVKDGVVCGLACEYANGMSWERGVNVPNSKHVLELDVKERITSVIITVGCEGDSVAPESILSLKLVTNDGKSLLAEDPDSMRNGYGRRLINKRAFSDVRSITFESPLERGYLIGFWGRSSEQGISPGLFRLGVVWCNTNAVEQKTSQNSRLTAALERDAANEIVVEKYDNLLREYQELQGVMDELEEEHKATKAQLDIKDKDLDDQKAAALKYKKLSEDLQKQVTALQEDVHSKAETATVTSGKVRELEATINRQTADINSKVDLLNEQARKAREKAEETQLQMKKVRDNAEETMNTERNKYESALKMIEGQLKEAKSTVGDLTSKNATYSTQIQRATALNKAGSFKLRHVQNSKYLTHNPGSRTADLISDQGNWTQRLYLQSGTRGFQMFTVDDAGQYWYLNVSGDNHRGDGNCKVVKFSNSSLDATAVYLRYEPGTDKA